MKGWIHLAFWMVAGACLALAMSCASRDTSLDAYPGITDCQGEHAEQGVRDMQDEFNRIYPDG